MSIEKNIDLKKLSTFHIGGKADFYSKISTKDDLQEAFLFAEKRSLPVLHLGGGSNLIFSDHGFRGIVFHYTNNQIYSSGDQEFKIQAGAKIMEVFAHTKKENADFSVFSTIPGTIGGAIAGNAGLPDGEIGDFIQEVELYDTKKNEFITVGVDFFNFSYRSTKFHIPEFANRYSIWSANIRLPFLEKDAISKKAKKYLQTRKEKQPWGKTGGSFFANPKQGASGYFLEQSGFKGFSLPGSDAFFSEKHANFLMNAGNATQQQIIELGRYAQKKVLDMHGVVLKNEVKLLDEYGTVLSI